MYRARKFLRRHRPAAFGAAAGLAFILLSAVTVWSLLRHDSPPKANFANKGTIVLGEFTNSTADPAFNGTLRQALAGDLGKSPYFSVLSDARMSETLRLMMQPVNTKPSLNVASEICERTGSAAVVESSVTSLGSQYLLSSRARNCRTGDVLDEEQAQAAKKEDVFKALGEMANRLQTWAAKSLPRLEKEPTLSAEVTTPSLEAWRSYSAAMKAQQQRGQTSEAIPLLKRAIELDPQFAMAYANLGRQYASFGESELGAQNIAKGYELRARVTDLENYFITFNYHRQVTRNLELARQTLESWTRQYPRDFAAHGFLAAFTTQGSGHYDKAVEEGLKAIELDPDYAIGYGNVAFAYIYLNRPVEAEALLRKAAERKIATTEFSLCRYFIAFLRNDPAAIERETAQRQAMEAQGWFEYQEALTMAYRGRLKEAARLSDNAVRLSAKQVCVSGLRSFKALEQPGTRFTGIGRRGKKRSCRAGALSKPGRRLRTRFWAGASARLRASSPDHCGTR